MRNYEARLAKLEAALAPRDSVIVYIRRFGKGRLRGLSCSDSTAPYFERGVQETEEDLQMRTFEQLERRGGFAVLTECRREAHG